MIHVLVFLYAWYIVLVLFFRAHDKEIEEGMLYDKSEFIRSLIIPFYMLIIKIINLFKD